MTSNDDVLYGKNAASMSGAGVTVTLSLEHDNERPSCLAPSRLAARPK